MSSSILRNRYQRFLAFVAGFFVCLICSSVYAQDEQNTNQTKQNALGSEQDLATQQTPNKRQNTFDPRSARAWMDRLVSQVASQSFEIVFVVSSSEREMLPYVWRRGRMPDNSPIEQLSMLNGVGFEQVMHQGRVSIFEPSRPPFSIVGTNVQSPIPKAIIYGGADIFAGYDLLLMGRNRVAGRMAQQIRIVSNDKTRFGYHLWLDEQSGLLLKLDTYNLEGKVVEQIQVTQVNVSDAIDQRFASFALDQLPEIATQAGVFPKTLKWNVSYMPNGMKVIKQNIHRIERTGKMTEYMLLSDGLVDVSVYVLSASEALSEDISIASSSHAVVTKTDGRIQATVVGEIPVTTANKIANSIVLVE